MGSVCSRRSRKRNDDEASDPSEGNEEDAQERAINAIVNRIMANDNINQRYIPDAVERRMYRNVVKVVIGMAQELTENSSIQVLGHRLSFTLVPIEPSI